MDSDLSAEQQVLLQQLKALRDAAAAQEAAAERFALIKAGLGAEVAVLETELAAQAADLKKLERQAAASASDGARCEREATRLSGIAEEILADVQGSRRGVELLTCALEKQRAEETARKQKNFERLGLEERYLDTQEAVLAKVRSAKAEEGQAAERRNVFLGEAAARRDALEAEAAALIAATWPEGMPQALAAKVETMLMGPTTQEELEAEAAQRT